MEISEECVMKSRHPAVTNKQAWAAYVRRRWSENCVAHVQREWDLSPDRARGVVYATITDATIDLIARHKRGGLKVEAAVLAVKWGLEADALARQLIEIEREGIARERARLDLQEAKFLALSRRVANPGARDRADPPR